MGCYMWFLMEAHFKILGQPLDSWRWNESGGGLEFWFWVPVGTARKMRQHKKWHYTDYLKKCDFLQMNPNIDILYIVGNYFLQRVWIRDRYLKRRFCLAQINCQSLANLYWNVCRQSGHFCREWRVPLRRGGWVELICTHVGHQNWPENDGARREASVELHAPPTAPPP